jgi:hypothetical protein
MVARGFPLLTAPTRRQVMLVQVGVWCAMALLAVLPFVVSAVAS